MDFNMVKPSKKRDCKLQENEQINGIDSLPTEIALDIFSRLSITSLMQSRFACRSWQNLSLDRNLVSMHLSQVAKRDPFLIFHSDFPIRNQLCFAELSGTDDGVNATVKKINIPFSASMPEFIVAGSCNGLLCLRCFLYKDAVYVYNPFTNKYQELPKTTRYDKKEVVCGFGKIPQTNQYKIVKIVHYDRALVRVLCILRTGEILVDFRVGKLGLYDVVSGKYKDLTLKGMPSVFQTVVHMGSLEQIDLCDNM